MDEITLTLASVAPSSSNSLPVVIFRSWLSVKAYWCETGIWVLPRPLVTGPPSVQTDLYTTVSSTGKHPPLHTITSTTMAPPNPTTPQSESAKLLEQESVKTFLNSDGSLDVLLARLKQSINTGDEIAKYVKKRAMIEDEHYAQLKKSAINIRSVIKNKNVKHDVFSSKFDQVIQFDEKLHGVGSSYVKALNVMSEELVSLVNTVTRNRKVVKEESKRKEKDCAEAVALAEKAKQKYYHLCDDLEKVKTSDPQKKSFLKNKTAEQQEDELQRKVDLADQDYKLKVSACKKLKDEMLMVHRPISSKKLMNLILEMDIAMNVQLQKFATWTETLIMNSGVLVSPLQAEKQSMKSIVSSIDNELDLFDYIQKNSKTLVNRALIPVEYVTHPSFAKNQKPVKPFFPNASNKNSHTNIAPAAVASVAAVAAPIAHAEPDRSVDVSVNSPQHDTSASSNFTYNSLDPGNNHEELTGPRTLGQVTKSAQPTFGVSIEDVIQYAGIDNVPLVVKRCIDVIENYGLNIEGIYRTSGNKSTVQLLREAIDANFANYLLIGNNIDPDNIRDADIYCAASLLKIYFASLPEPLLTQEYYRSFIDTVKSLDETFIAKKLHHLVYNLPDGAYFTLRALMFHLNKVAEHQSENRMNQKSLAIIWGPALLNDDSMSPQDLSYKSKVVEELMLIANEIFDQDD